MMPKWFLDNALNSGKFEIYDYESRCTILNSASFYWSYECGCHHQVLTFAYGIWC